MLGGGSFVNLVIFEEIAKLPEEAAPTIDSFYKLTNGKQFNPKTAFGSIVQYDARAQIEFEGSYFYQSIALQWFSTLNSSKEKFKQHYLYYAQHVYGQPRHGRSLEEDVQWLKEWEETADKEGIY